MEFVNSLLSQVVIYATVYTLTSLGIVLAGRTGIFNVSGEGVLLVSASLGFMASYFSGSWVLGFVAGAAVGALFGLLLALLHEGFGVNQFIAGIILAILGSGLSDLLYKVVMGVRLTAPVAPEMPEVSLFGRVPIVSALLNHNPVVYFTYAMTALLWWFLYRTRMGLETRAIGESPHAADVVGINVRGRRYAATVIGGSLMGIAGAFLPIFLTGTYNPNISGGRGFITIGIAIFASWKPERALLGGLVFAAVEVLSFQLQLLSDTIPFQFFLMLPFVVVLAIMMLFRRRIEFPASIGEPYRRE